MFSPNSHGRVTKRGQNVRQVAKFAAAFYKEAFGRWVFIAAILYFFFPKNMSRPKNSSNQLNKFHEFFFCKYTYMFLKISPGQKIFKLTEINFMIFFSNNYLISRVDFTIFYVINLIFTVPIRQIKMAKGEVITTNNVGFVRKRGIRLGIAQMFRLQCLVGHQSPDLQDQNHHHHLLVQVPPLLLKGEIFWKDFFYIYWRLVYTKSLL